VQAANLVPDLAMLSPVLAVQSSRAPLSRATRAENETVAGRACNYGFAVCAPRKQERAFSHLLLNPMTNLAGGLSVICSLS
jgi:hypothetical protein